MTANPRRTPPLLIAAVVLVKLGIYLFFANRYGYLSDELYFLDASAHPAFGYVDFPPMIAWVVGAIRVVFSDALWVLRLAAAIIGTLVALICIDLCRLLGGGIVARCLTAAVVLFAPGVISIQGLMTMNVLDQLWWVLSAWLLIQYLQRDQPEFMWSLGAALGLGLLTKLSIAAFGAGLLVATAIWRRDLFRRRETWLALMLVVVISLPFAIWQIVNGYPLLDFISAYNATPPRAIVLQNPALGLILTMNPLYALIWAPGAVLMLATKDRSQRMLGTAAWVSLFVFALAGVKFYFAVPVLILFSIAGAVWWERWLGAVFTWRATAAVAVVTLAGLAAVPMAAPVLPAAQLQQLADYLYASETRQTLTGPAELERYFPHFAEMHGWPELVELVVQISGEIGTDEYVIVAAHFGQAGAINRLDPDDRLPAAYSGHMSYAFWNESADFSRALFIGFTADELQAMYQVVEEKGRLDCQRCMHREKTLRAYLAEQPKISNREIRERIRRYDFF